MHKEYRQRIANEYRYAVTKMQDAGSLDKKLFYFSVIFSEPQRVLNWDWENDLALIHFITKEVHQQLIGAISHTHTVVPIDWSIIVEALTKATIDLTVYFEMNETNGKELLSILGRFAAIAYSVTGNGGYLYEKGLFKL